MHFGIGGLGLRRVPRREHARARKINRPTMVTCYQCHTLEEDARAPGECTLCHRRTWSPSPNPSHGQLDSELHAEAAKANPSTAPRATNSSSATPATGSSCRTRRVRGAGAPELFFEDRRSATRAIHGSRSSSVTSATRATTLRAERLHVDRVAPERRSGPRRGDLLPVPRHGYVPDLPSAGAGELHERGSCGGRSSAQGFIGELARAPTSASPTPGPTGE